MKRVLMIGLLAAGTILGSGCVVWSLYPWLDEKTTVSQPALAGIWSDTNKNSSAVFTPATNWSDYSIDWHPHFCRPSGKPEKYEASVHDVDGVPLLMVGTWKEDVASPAAMLPAYLLFRIQLTNSSLKLFQLDFATFEKRARKSRLLLAARDPKNKDGPIIVTSLTADMTAFVRRNLKDKTFFSAEPLYSFTKLAGAEGAAGLTNAPAQAAEINGPAQDKPQPSPDPLSTSSTSNTVKPKTQ